MNTMHVTWEWNRKQAIFILDSIYTKKYLNKLSDYELFELGVKEEMWHGDNPFKREKQQTLAQ